MKFEIPEGFRQFLIKLAIFSGLFILISTIIGPFIVNTNLLYGSYFFIYGGLGNLFLFSIVAFILLARNKLPKLEKYDYNKKEIIFGFLSLPLIFLFFFLGNSLIQEPNILLAIAEHLVLISIFIFLALAVFNYAFIRDFIRKFSKEIKLIIIISLSFYFAMFFIWNAWKFFSFFVLKIVRFFLELSSFDVKVIPPRTIIVGGFGAEIEKACSGVYSIFLFSVLYLLISYLDWKILNKKKIILMFFPAIIGLFFVNCLRIYLLILAGIFISPHFAQNLFHSYIGMLLFIGYFAIFWLIFYKWMKK